MAFILANESNNNYTFVCNISGSEVKVYAPNIETAIKRAKAVVEAKNKADIQKNQLKF